MQFNEDTMNFPIKHNGKTYWISRSCALVGVIYAKNNSGQWCVLAEKRGPGCPDEIGKWCVPCGYIERNKEDGPEGLVRECFEETGLRLDKDKFKLIGVSYDRDEKQNICHYYKMIITDATVEELSRELDSSNSEPDEVDALRFIPLKDIDEYDWAFNHHGLVQRVFEITNEIPLL